MKQEKVDTPDAILRFLESIGRRSEAEFYLSLFRAEQKESFANLVVAPSVLRGAFEAVVLDLRFLHGLGLCPVVSLGVQNGSANDSEWAERLRRKLDKRGVPAMLLPSDTPDLASAVATAARGGQIPIVAFKGGDPADVAGRFDALAALCRGLATQKVIFLARHGGLMPKGSDRHLPTINLATDYESIVAQKYLTQREYALLEQSRRLLVEGVAHRMVVTVTSPLQLLRELFTVKGAGTLIKRGSTIVRKGSFAETDVPRLHALLESSFGKQLRREYFDHEVSSIYLEEGYRGAAIVRPLSLGAYLCKFAVDRLAQGEGIGRDLWQKLVSDYPTFVWRSTPKNSIMPFYVQECDGMARTPSWTVFWKGLPGDRVPEAIAVALAQPIDFERAQDRS